MPNGTIRTIFWILFFVSGAIGLIYEVVELRLIHLAIGSNSISVYVVLSAFMAGMAICSRWGGLYLDKVQRPLVAYALLELAVGISSLPFFFVGRWGSILGALFTPEFLRGSDSLPLWRAFVSFLFLLPPSALMGATLPALSRYFIPAERKGLEGGRLYALNTCGAVAVCFVTGFFLIDSFGVFGTLTLAMAGSSTIALVALLMGRKAYAPEPMQPEPVERT